MSVGSGAIPEPLPTQDSSTGGVAADFVGRPAGRLSVDAAVRGIPATAVRSNAAGTFALLGWLTNPFSMWEKYNKKNYFSGGKK